MSATIDQLTTRPHFVYRAFDSDGALLYVGCSLNVERRMQEHKSFAAWHRLVARVETEGPFSYTEARELEWRAIQTERPACNAQSPLARQQKRARNHLFTTVCRTAIKHGESTQDAVEQAAIACAAEYGI